VKYKVTEIKEGAFKRNKKITKVTIGKNVTKIGAEAFSECKKLSKIEFEGSSVKTIGNNAFKDIGKKALFKLPGKAVNTYLTLIKKAGAPSKSRYETEIGEVEETTPTPNPTITVTPTPTPTPESKEILIQDIRYYAGDEMTFEMANTAEDKSTSRKFTGQEADLEIVKNYVKMLAEQNPDFVLNPEYEKSYNTSLYGASTFYSASLVYKGSKKVGKQIEQSYDNLHSGHISISVSIQKGALKGFVFLSEGITFEDLGKRADGNDDHVERVDIDSTLIEKDDGSFSYGKMTTTIGKASVLRDGTLYQTENVSINRNSTKSKEEIKVYYFYRDEGIAMTFPYHGLMTGDKYTEKNLAEVYRGSDAVVRKMDDFINSFTANYKFGVCHNGDYMFAYADAINDLHRVTVRVLKWDEIKNVAVFYIACEFTTEPYTYEVLMAARMMSDGQEPAPTGNNNNTTPAPSPTTTAKANCIMCDGTGRRKCTVCDGKGGRDEYQSGSGIQGIGLGKWVWKECTTCDGKGYKECTYCHGTGHQ